MFSWDASSWTSVRNCAWNDAKVWCWRCFSDSACELQLVRRSALLQASLWSALQEDWELGQELWRYGLTRPLQSFAMQKVMGKSWAWLPHRPLLSEYRNSKGCQARKKCWEWGMQ
jgi:hypothetical protein